ncbi:MAG: Pycsar system effector family protein [Paracoccus sp. (in: a-proteobacteria)]
MAKIRKIREQFEAVAATDEPDRAGSGAGQTDEATMTMATATEAPDTGGSAGTGKVKKKKNKAGESELVGSNKAVDTMYRNAYRAELDTIALAATKANIMISLNGFIISALMISGAFIFASSPAFLLPAGVFMFTAAVSIIFALLSASPERADLMAAVWGWTRDVAARRARLRDLRARVLVAQEPAPSEDLNVLIYEDRMRLSRAEYWSRMQALMRDREQVYFRMSDQLYWLGAVADRKFRLLALSYTSFRWGLLASVVIFIGLKGAMAALNTASGESIVRLRNLGIGSFEAIYEPSAVQQLSDGRILVVEDEAARAMNLLTISEDGTLTEDRATGLRMARSFGRQLNDLEGLTIDAMDRVYAITSHSLTNKGERNPDREQLLRFRVSGSSVGEIRSVTNLREALTGDQVVTEMLTAELGEEPDFDELNIEGLAYLRQSGQLYLGLRAPLAGDRSIIIPIENPDRVFDDGAAPRFGPPVLLDLRGGGIRALSFDPILGSFLMVNEIEGYEGNRYSQLWSWSGDPDARPEPIALPDIINLNNVESIDSITLSGEPRLLIMSDEGSEKKNEPARYMMLDYEQLAP